jgi:Domain of unknown function (DUF4382)
MRRIFVVTAFVLSLASLTLFISCKKNDTGDGNARLQVYLTDAPGDYEAVYIDIKDVQINITTNDDDDGWQSLQSVNARVYDLLRLVNDKDTILADTEIRAGSLHEIRLVLGTENYVKIRGKTELIKLETSSAEQSGLTLNVQEDVTESRQYKIILDFDVARSVVQTGNNQYSLKPTIRPILNAMGGTIKGVVMPGSFRTVVYAIQGVDTLASTFTGTTGGYVFKGMPAGSYSFYYLPSNNAYQPLLKTGISVMFNTTTKIDTCYLHQ